MRTIARTSAIAAALLVTSVLVGCAPAERPSEDKVVEVEPVAPAEAPDTSGPKTSDRGHLIKQIGETAGLSNASGSEDWVDFTVTGITPEAACTSEYYSAPENGYFVRVDMDIVTTPQLQGEFLVNINNQWKWIADNGTTANSEPMSGAAWGCLADSERLPSAVGPAESVTGSLILDVPSTSGTLVYAPSGSSGWEWVVPAS